MRPEQVQASVAAALQSLQGGDFARAGALSAGVLRIAPREPTSLMIAGLAAHAAGNSASALEFLIRADVAAPGNAMILGNLGVVYRALDRFTESEAAYRRALDADPSHTPTRLNLARLLDQTGQLAKAEAEFRAVVAAHPTQGDALAGLAAVLEQRHQLDEAAVLARQALASGPVILAGLTLAKVAIRQKRANEALSAIERVRVSPLTPVNAALADGLEGQAQELSKDYHAAFVAFERANERLRQLYAPAFENGRSIASDQLLRDMAAFFGAGAPHGLVSPADSNSREGHTFLLGFPRSGTTLLEQALAAHPDVQTLEEKDTLAAPLGDLVAAPSVSAFFQALRPDVLAGYRAAYWASVAQNLGGAPMAKVFIDKMPINSAYLGLIARLFPDARIIFAIRDPRDVILSCFQQRFGMNAVMYRFLTLKGAAELYDGVMLAADAARRALPLRLHDIRYEALTADFEGELKRLTGFLGLPWRAGILDFREKSRDRLITTPSAAQIMEPVTTHATGRFRAYAKQLGPILPVANAWAEKFGYPAA